MPEGDATMGVFVEPSTSRAQSLSDPVTRSSLASPAKESSSSWSSLLLLHHEVSSRRQSQKSASLRRTVLTRRTTLLAFRLVAHYSIQSVHAQMQATPAEARKYIRELARQTKGRLWGMSRIGINIPRHQSQVKSAADYCRTDLNMWLNS
jgi:hypothetical protein